jgi:hypothetical protein
MEAQRIDSWRGLEKFGVISLTGESCTLGLRLLCDLTESGVRLLQEHLGGNVDFREGSNWNTTTRGQKHVASVMLPHNGWMDLAVIALFMRGHTHVLRMGQNEYYTPQVIGMNEEEWEEWRQIIAKTGMTNYRLFAATAGHPRKGTRNVHYMSQRSR